MPLWTASVHFGSIVLIVTGSNASSNVIDFHFIFFGYGLLLVWLGGISKGEGILV
jgi:hypothetical protein